MGAQPTCAAVSMLLSPAAFVIWALLRRWTQVRGRCSCPSRTTYSLVIASEVQANGVAGTQPDLNAVLVTQCPVGLPRTTDRPGTGTGTGTGTCSLYSVAVCGAHTPVAAGLGARKS